MAPTTVTVLDVASGGVVTSIRVGRARAMALEVRGKRETVLGGWARRERSKRTGTKVGRIPLLLVLLFSLTFLTNFACTSEASVSYTSHTYVNKVGPTL